MGIVIGLVGAVVGTAIGLFWGAPISCPPPAAVSWSPRSPRAGSLFRVTVAMDAARALETPIASVSGEPLHFRDDGKTAVAFAAVPVDSVNGVTLEWQCNGETRETQRIGTTQGSYALERLRVAPRFGAPPDSMTAERMRVESERAASVSRASHETARLWSAPFMAPRSSRITSLFGGGRTFNGAVTSRHMGTDFAGAVGAPVMAANSGVVRLVDRFIARYGTITIDPASLLRQR